jgi:hypothetical protein
MATALLRSVVHLLCDCCTIDSGYPILSCPHHRPAQTKWWARRLAWLAAIRKSAAGRT